MPNLDPSDSQDLRRVLITAMERVASSVVAESTMVVVPLPNEEMKGRLIGREGRNIKAFEQITGVDLLIDDTPQAVMLSSFDARRREIARLTLLNLLADGRIQPGKIEELHAHSESEIDLVAREAAEAAIREAGIGPLQAGLIEALARLRFRTAYGQNVLAHSVEVSRLAGQVAVELGLPDRGPRLAGLLHDVGKGLGPEFEGPHALAGMEFLRAFGLDEEILNAVGAHHREIEPASATADLVILADTLSASRPAARRGSLENYLQRLEALEEIARNVEGVAEAVAYQAGRAVRVQVRPERVADEELLGLAESIAAQIKAQFPESPPVQVTVLRTHKATATSQ